jgi:hypothetical protein
MSDSEKPVAPGRPRRNDTPSHDAIAFDPAARIHLVCVTCNNMFEVNAAHFDAKQCPTCRRVE